MKAPWAHTNAATVDDGLGFAYRLSAATGVLLLVASLCGLILGSRGIYDPDPATLSRRSTRRTS